MLCSVYSYWSASQSRSRCSFTFASLYLIFIVYVLCLWASLRLWVTSIEKLGNWTVTTQKLIFRLNMFQSIILNFEQPDGYFLISFMTLTCSEKKLKRLEKCLGLGLSKSRLGLVSGWNSNVSVSFRSRKNVGRSWSPSRLGLKNKCLGLGPGGLVYNPGSSR